MIRSTPTVLPSPHRRRTAIGVAAGAVAVFLLYATRLAYSPMYLSHDEAIYALSAHSIATTLRDVQGHLLPVYFYVGGNFWAMPVHIYVMALFQKLFGLSEPIIRTPSATIGTLNVILMFAIARKIFASTALAAVAAAFMALTPAHFIHSRLATDHIYVLPFLLGWLWCLLAFWERPRPGLLFAATSLLGAGVYTYLAAVALMPVYLAVTFLVLYANGRRAPREWLTALAGFAWPLLPLVPWMLTHPTQAADQLRMYGLYDSRHAGAVQALTQVAGSGAVAGLTRRLDVYYDFFNPSFLFFSGDTSYINATRHAGVLPLAFAVLVPLGILALLAGKRTPVIRLLLLVGFVIAPIAGVLVAEVKINRALVMIPFAALLATEGVASLFQADRARRVAAIVLVAAVPLQFVSFYRDYMTSYRLVSAYWFEGNIRGALEELMRRNPPGAARPIYLDTEVQWLDWYWPLYLAKDGRGDLQPLTVYFDRKTIDIARMPAGSSIMTRAQSVSQPPFRDIVPQPAVTLIREPDGSASFAVLDR